MAEINIQNSIPVLEAIATNNACNLKNMYSDWKEKLDRLEDMGLIEKGWEGDIKKVKLSSAGKIVLENKDKGFLV